MMTNMRAAIVVIVSAVALVIAGPASALVLAPPGKSGASQYVEVIPTSSGNAAPPGSVPGSGTGGSISRLGAGTAGTRALARLGHDGQAAAALAKATAPVAAAGVVGAAAHGTTGGQGSAGGHGSSTGHGGTRGAVASGHSPNAATTSDTSGQSLPGGVTSALTSGGSGGIGVALPILLVTSLLVAIGLGIARLRRTNDPPAAA
jgi:hypothetical protein